MNIQIEKNDNNLKTCQICKRVFTTQKGATRHIHDIHNILHKDYYDQYYKTENEGKCKKCGNETTFSFGKYLDYCSYNCSNNAIDINKQRGESIKEAWKTFAFDKRQLKTDETILEHYGTVENYHRNRIEKSKKACLEKYGSTNWIQSEIGKTKFKQIIFGKYGVENVSQLEDVKTKIRKQINLNTYENLKRFQSIVKPLFKSENYHGNNKTDLYDWLCCKCGKPFKDYYDNGAIPRCLSCFPHTRSAIEGQIKEFLDNKHIQYIQTTKSILKNFKELDFYIKDKQLAIEVDGLYWHSEISGNKDKNYHLAKTLECEKMNIKLIHIFEDEIINKSTLIEQKLKHILGLIQKSIPARKCLVKEIDHRIKNKFMNKYHIQGEDKSAINLGLYYKNRLVAMMTFSKLRKALGQIHKEGSWELSRYATIANFNIIGGAGKLLKHFERTYNPLKLITYADRRWSQGNMYNQLGFNLDHISPPNYWYVLHNHRRRIHRFNFRKNVLKDKLKTFDSKLTEWENMQLNGHDRIWDCGNLVFIKNYERKI